MPTKHVTMKGTRDGFVIHLDDTCTFEQLLSSLERFLTDERVSEKIEVDVHLGYRYCSEEMIQQIEMLFQQSVYFTVREYDSFVVTKELCRREVEKLKTEQYIGIVRSGQVLQAEGDIVIIGDINPNGKVVAKGNIFILGQLKGAAHAGAAGDSKSVIVASHMEPTHLMIADVTELVNEDSPLLLHTNRMECVHLLDDGQMTMSELKDLRLARPDLMTRIGGFQ